MEVLPSIDLMKGNVVRLVKGDPGRSKVYSSDPVATAGMWQEQGALRLHIVDLDAALEQGSNLSIIEAIVRSVDAEVEVGGGVRSLSQASHLLDLGVERVMLGTIALKDRRIVSSLIEAYGRDRVMVALDYLGGKVMVRGWKQASKPLMEAFGELVAEGVRRFLFTDVGRDGTLEGPDVETLVSIAGIRGIDVIASGGIRSLGDLVALKRVGVTGVVVGTALYEGLFTLGEALKTVNA